MILKRLKEATGFRHAALESRLPLLDVGMSRARYLEFLHLFFGYYEPLEAKLLTLPYWKSIGFDYAERRKTSRLTQDLLVLGETPETIQRSARCKNLPTIATQGQLLGCLYVIEGATLGGQIITRHLHANLGLTPLSGSAFFDGYGAQTGRQWKNFCTMLRTNAGETGGQDDILETANRTFETLDQWLFPNTQRQKVAHHE